MENLFGFLTGALSGLGDYADQERQARRKAEDEEYGRRREYLSHILTAVEQGRANPAHYAQAFKDMQAASAAPTMTRKAKKGMGGFLGETESVAMPFYDMLMNGRIPMMESDAPKPQPNAPISGGTAPITFSQFIPSLDSTGTPFGWKEITIPAPRDFQPVFYSQEHLARLARAAAAADKSAEIETELKSYYDFIAGKSGKAAADEWLDNYLNYHVAGSPKQTALAPTTFVTPTGEKVRAILQNNQYVLAEPVTYKGQTYLPSMPLPQDFVPYTGSETMWAWNNQGGATGVPTRPQVGATLPTGTGRTTPPPGAAGAPGRAETQARFDVAQARSLLEKEQALIEDNPLNISKTAAEKIALVDEAIRAKYGLDGKVLRAIVAENFTTVPPPPPAGEGGGRGQGAGPGPGTGAGIDADKQRRLGSFFQTPEGQAELRQFGVDAATAISMLLTSTDPDIIKLRDRYLSKVR